LRINAFKYYLHNLSLQTLKLSIDM